MYKIWFARNYRSRGANTLLLDNALATMGAGLPSAMMASHALSRRRVLAVCGDGGFMMNSQELETAVRLGLDLVVLILQDNAYGMIRWKQAVDDFPDFGLTFGNPDFVALRRGLRRHGRAGRGDRGPRARRWRPRSRPAACTWSPSRSTTPRTSASSSTSCATASPRRRGGVDHAHPSSGARPPWARSAPYAESRAARDRRARARVPGPRRGAGADQGRRPVPLGPLGDQRQPAAADADGARPRGGRHRRGGRARPTASASRTSPSATTSCACSCPRAGIASRARRAGPRCASRARSPTAPGTLLSGARRLHRGDGTPVHHHLGVSAFAEYATVSRRSLVKVDPELPLDDAALFGCAVLTGVGAVVNTARVPVGASVAVIGLGGVGLSSLLGAVAAGAREVVAIDLSDDKLDVRARARRHRRRSTPRDPECAEQVRAATDGRRRVRVRARRLGPGARPRLQDHPPRRHDRHRRAARRRTRRCRCLRSPWSPRSARSRAATSAPRCRAATSRATSSSTSAGACRSTAC